MVYSYIYIQYLNFFSVSGRREIRGRLRIYISSHQENVADHLKTLKTSRMPRKKLFLVSIYALNIQTDWHRQIVSTQIRRLLTSRNQRRSLCKFRISSHKLEIEQGRYTNISADKRTCMLCNNGVEDEIHFLLKCSVLEKIRKNILSMIYKLYPNTKN